MTVVGAADVDAAAARGVLQVGARDIVTPLARERAREAGVEIVVATPGAAAAVAGDRATPYPSSPVPASPVARPAPAAARVRVEAAPPPVRPPSGALFRRGAPLPPAVRPGGAGPARGTTGRVVVVGAGNVGTITGMRLAEADVFAEVVLVDIDEGRAAGVALDLTHTAALCGFATRVRGAGTVEAAGPADYVVITAGKARQPGMSRSDLTSTNAAIVGDVAARVAVTSPHAVVVVVTNPLDEMTQHAWRASGFPPERVLGMAGVLDTARFQALAALDGSVRADRVEAWALGSHGEEMVIPLSRASADGRPLGPGVDAVVDRARGSGAEVVGLLRSGSAFLAPGTSAARMVLAMAADSGEVMPAAVLADGTYGIRDVYVGLPARLGRGGVREIVELDLLPDELSALHEAAERIRERVGRPAGDAA
ncbi:malate dehydrogenase [Pseudonocardia oceani]|uniref:Malate dehydrogenase n=3 Tax=Pseudonocardia oceani TaxID=2792013 RepID=A0ABS6UHR6_9PSEU|nr:malate dehydrogenase [Pseudonocardia oceani]MBW0122270.1 malate dehydrogenase [Pseudonocardia oceani]MBW0131778.1 malate dehydrogenase [Pseudonocardia oceani]